MMGIGCLAFSGLTQAAEVQEADWQRIDSRYCTVWLQTSVDVRKVNQKINTWHLKPEVKTKGFETEEDELAAKCDTIFRRAEEILDMYPPGVHVTLRIAKKRDELKDIHAGLFGYGTEAVAFYVFEENTIYASEKDISESVLVHEMAHCIIDHYFQVRPPRKIEELLAMHVDAHLRSDT